MTAHQRQGCWHQVRVSAEYKHSCWRKHGWCPQQQQAHQCQGPGHAGIGAGHKRGRHLTARPSVSASMANTQGQWQACLPPEGNGKRG
jgi:hypothetical protein